MMPPPPRVLSLLFPLVVILQGGRNAVRAEEDTHANVESRGSEETQKIAETMMMNAPMKTPTDTLPLFTDITVDQRERYLAFGVAETNIEFNDVRITVLVDHESDIENTPIGDVHR